jgi:LPS-assembly protein
MRSVRLIRAIASSLALVASPCAAQPTLSGWTVTSDTTIQIGENHYVLRGHVEIEQGDTKLYAEQMDFYPNEDRAVAEGNVLFSQGNNRIGADSAEFNTRTRLGVFRHAYGIASIRAPRQAAAAPSGLAQLRSQESDVYFFGDVVEKIAPKKYKITNGGFTTCVQPTPRWDLHANTVVLYVDHYTMLRDAVLKVKGVPLLYLPFMYYPTKEEDRATGFLIPTYGVSSVRGQSIHDAFFWAIDRSQDVTILHDWFSKGGQGVGSEYRYNWGGGSDGNLNAYVLDQRGDADTNALPDLRSFELRGSANQMLPGRLRARANVNYFSSLATKQTFNMNVYDASRSDRTFGGNVVGAWGTYSLNATVLHSEHFYNSTDSTVSGSTPRLQFSRNERPIVAGSPVYFSFGGEYAHVESGSRTATLEADRSLSRFDFSPQVRYPFKRWPFFTVNSSLLWRETFYTRSLDPLNPAAVVDDDVNRQYFTVRAQAVGPVFTRVWNTPGNGYAERFKHSIEPVFSVERISSIDQAIRSRIVQSDGSDYAVGGTTNVSYGLNNRFYAKRRVGQTSVPQEILTVSVSQSYYTNENASTFDTSYQTSGLTADDNNFSPVKVDVRAQPSPDLGGTVRAEIDSRYKELRTLSVNANYGWTNRLQTSIGWTRRFLIRQLVGFDNPNTLDSYLNASVNAQTRDNRFGGRYTFYYDVRRSTMQQQRFAGFYNAQCCGLALEYQTFSFGSLTSVTGVASDHRFFLSFTLAGLGNFSPFNGALSGIPR